MYFMFHAHSRPTGQHLARALNMPAGDAAPVAVQDLLVRWGTQQRAAYKPAHVINPLEAVALASDKYFSLVALRDAGVTVPEFDRDVTRLTAPIFGRANTHTRGMDVKIYAQHADVAFKGTSDYYTQYVPCQREFRVHVVGDEVVKVSEKRLDTPATITTAALMVRNHDNGWRFMQPRTPTPITVPVQALQAVKALHLDFGAVDVIVGDDNRTYVLEVNTAPACSPTTGRKYVDGIVKIAAGYGIALTPNYEALDVLGERDDA